MTTSAPTSASPTPTADVPEAGRRRRRWLGLSVLATLAMLVGALRELSRKTGRIASPWEQNVRKAAAIAILTMIFRGQFDAKEWDWSFYILCTIAGISGAMMKSRSPPAEVADQPPADAAPALPATNKLTF